MTIYNKLVRDKIPDIIEASGCRAKTRILNDEEFLVALGEKAVEEAMEFKDNPVLDELADIQEVLITTAHELG
jgi:predicted house-cleaning noncanonical NTP pyrophosphatase (MazG superfamily)